MFCQDYERETYRIGRSTNERKYRIIIFIKMYKELKVLLPIDESKCLFLSASNVIKYSGYLGTTLY